MQPNSCRHKFIGLQGTGSSFFSGFCRPWWSTEYKERGLSYLRYPTSVSLQLLVVPMPCPSLTCVDLLVAGVAKRDILWALVILSVRSLMTREELIWCWVVAYEEEVGFKTEHSTPISSWYRIRGIKSFVLTAIIVFKIVSFHSAIIPTSCFPIFL